MCANENRHSAAGADDVWDTDSGSEQEPNATQSQLDREWEARKQQYYNAGYREGVDEGKEATLQSGFNAGFAEGARAGFEFGLVKGALQLLAGQLDETDSRRTKVQELLQQVSGLSNKTAMQDTCRALLAQRPDDTISAHLQAALTLADQGGASVSQPQEPSSSTDPSSSATAPAGPAALQEGEAASSSGTAELPLPLQLAAFVKQELQQVGFDVESAPTLTVASSSCTSADAHRSSD